MGRDVTLEKMKLASLIDDWYIKDRRVQRYGFLNLKSFSSQQQTQYHRALKFLKTALTQATVTYQDKRILQKAWMVASRDIFDSVSTNAVYKNILLNKISEINLKIQRQKEYISPQTLEKVSLFTEKCLKTMIEGGNNIARVGAHHINKDIQAHSKQVLNTPPVTIDITGASKQGRPSPSIIPHIKHPSNAQNLKKPIPTKKIHISVNHPVQGNVQKPRKRPGSQISIQDAHRVLYNTFANFVHRVEEHADFKGLSISHKIELYGRYHSIVNIFQKDLHSYNDSMISGSRLHAIIRKFHLSLNEVLPKLKREILTIKNIEHRLKDKISRIFRVDYREYFEYSYQQILFEGILKIQLDHIQEHIRQRYGYLNPSEYQYQVSIKFTRKHVDTLTEKIKAFRPIQYDETAFNPNPIRYEQVKEYVFQLMQKYNTSELGYAQMSVYTSRIEAWMTILEDALDNSPHPSVTIQLANWFTKSSKKWIVSSFEEATKINLKKLLSPYDSHISLVEVEDSFVKVYGSLVGQQSYRVLHQNLDFKTEIVDLRNALLDEVKRISNRGRLNVTTYRLYHETVFPQYIMHVINSFA